MLIPTHIYAIKPQQANIMSGNRIKKLLAEKERRKQMAADGMVELAEIQCDLDAWRQIELPRIMMLHGTDGWDQMLMGNEKFIARLQSVYERN